MVASASLFKYSDLFKRMEKRMSEWEDRQMTGETMEGKECQRELELKTSLSPQVQRWKKERGRRVSYIHEPHCVAPLFEHLPNQLRMSTAKQKAHYRWHNKLHHAGISRLVWALVKSFTFQSGSGAAGRDNEWRPKHSRWR
jgi:hypothetical protein|uniref:Uncharacterized protein n=1 Tax=Bionectria ochroleuca TaxID=29856 RepID=A0A8H7NIA0_BIOOC